MAKLSRLAGSTGNILTLFIQNSTSTVGAGLTGLTNASTGLTCYYKRNTGTASVAVTLASITTLGNYVSGGFKEIDATNMPGCYEFHPPDAALASGAKSVAFYLQGAANMVVKPVEIELTAVDNQDAVRFGLTAIPNVAQGSAGSIPTSADASGRTNVGKFLDRAVVLDANFYPSVNIVDVGGVAASASTGVTVSGYVLGQDPATLLLATPANKLATDGSGRVTVGTNSDKTGYTASTVTDKSGYSLSVTPPTATAIATAVWTDATAADFTTAGTPGKILVGQLGGTFTSATSTIFTAPALANAPSGTGASAASIATAVWQDLTAGSDFSTANSIGSLLKTYTAPPTTSAIASAILTTPAQRIATDATGRVTVGSNADKVGYSLAGNVNVGGYATGQDPASLVLATPANKIATDATGAVSLSMTQSIPLANTPQTIGDALNAARAQGFGRWLFDANAKTLKLFGPDGATVVRTFALDSVTNPTART